MIRNIHLYGKLAEQFGKLHRYDVDTITEACWAIHINKGNFFQALKEGSYQIVVGDCIPEEDHLIGRNLSKEELNIELNDVDFHIYPIIAGEGGGSSSKGVITAILGMVIIAASFGTASFLAVPMSQAIIGGITYSHVALLGGVLALGGIAQLLAPMPKVGNYNERVKDKSSFLIQGPVNRIEQGGCIPVVFGKFTRGSTLISAGMQVHDVDPDDGTSPIYKTLTLRHENNSSFSNFSTIPVPDPVAGKPGVYESVYKLVLTPSLPGEYPINSDFIISVSSSKTNGCVKITLDEVETIFVNCPINEYHYVLQSSEFGIYDKSHKVTMIYQEESSATKNIINWDANAGAGTTYDYTVEDFLDFSPSFGFYNVPVGGSFTQTISQKSPLPPNTLLDQVVIYINNEFYTLLYPVDLPYTLNITNIQEDLYISYLAVYHKITP